MSFFPAEYKPALSYLGTHSGRDCDKVAEAGLTPKELAGGVTFDEASLTFVCKRLYKAPFEREGLAGEINNGVYANWQPRWMYMGEIVEAEDLQ